MNLVSKISLQNFYEFAAVMQLIEEHYDNGTLRKSDFHKSYSGVIEAFREDNLMEVLDKTDDIRVDHMTAMQTPGVGLQGAYLAAARGSTDDSWAYVLPKSKKMLQAITQKFVGKHGVAYHALVDFHYHRLDYDLADLTIHDINRYLKYYHDFI